MRRDYIIAGTMEMPRSRTLPDLLDEMAERHPDREAVVGASGRLTYAQWRERSRDLARGLHRLGVRRGDKGALLMPNRTPWLGVDFAVTPLRGPPVPLPPRAPPPAL